MRVNEDDFRSYDRTGSLDRTLKKITQSTYRLHESQQIEQKHIT
jgi:hypothetical protein